MTKDEAVMLLTNYERAVIDIHDFVNAHHRRGKLENHEKREFKAARAILIHLVPNEKFTDDELRAIIG